MALLIGTEASSRLLVLCRTRSGAALKRWPGVKIMSKQPVRVVGERKGEPELRKLARALIAIAVRQAEAAGDGDAEFDDGQPAVKENQAQAVRKAAS